nr:MAG TPA: hypothetical protein [Caudoviricetes sp.]
MSIGVHKIQPISKHIVSYVALKSQLRVYFCAHF